MPNDMKRIARPDLTAAEASRLGEELREARMALGVSVADMAQQIRIRRIYLQALEEGRLQDLPGQAYVVGFLRNYANALGLDTDEVLRRFREVSEPGGPKANLVFPEPVPSRGVPAGAVMLAGAVLAVGAYVFWYNWSGGGPRVVDGVPPLPPRLEQAADEIAPRPPAQVAAVAPPAEAPAAPATRGLTPPAAQPAAPSPTPGAPPTSAPPTAVAPPAAPAAGQTAATPPAGEGSRITLRGRSEAWIQLRDTRANRVITDRVLRAGETMAVPLREGLMLTTGRAEGMELLVDGNPAPALQNIVGVRRDIPMDPDRLMAGPLPAPPRPAQREQREPQVIRDQPYQPQ